MSKPITITVKVELTIDPDDWAAEYACVNDAGERDTIAEIRADAKGHLAAYLDDLINNIGGLSYMYDAEVTA